MTPVAGTAVPAMRARGGARSYAIFSAQYPPHMGGIETFTQSLAGALAARGARVLVVTNDTEGLGAGVSEEGGFEVMRLSCVPLVSGRLPLPRAGAGRSALLRELGRRELDGVLVNARFYPHSLLGMRVARERGLTPVVLDHGSAYLSLSSPALDVAVRAYEDAVTAWGRRYHASYYGISRRSAEWLAHFGIEAAGVIPNAIDAGAYRTAASGRDFRAELGVPEGAPVIASVGRLIAEKGVRSIISAAGDARLCDTGAVFVLAGDGPLADEVRAAEGPGLRWVGRLERADVAALLLQADLMCLPSRSEGFATALLEAAACGCPSLVTDVGGAREVVGDGLCDVPGDDACAGPGDGSCAWPGGGQGDGPCGRILSDARPETLVRELLVLLGNRDALRAMGERCLARADAFSWDATARAVENALGYSG